MLRKFSVSKLILSGALILIGFLALPKIVLADTHVNGSIASTTWTQDQSPYIVDGDVTIVAGEHLVIEPGVVVKFTPGTSLTTSGSLEAVGTSSDPILFTSDAADPHPSDWQGIISSNSADQIQNTEIRYAEKGLLLKSPITLSDLKVNNCYLGIYLNTSVTATIQNSQINNNTVGIYAWIFASGKIDHNTISHNLDAAIALQNSKAFEISDNDLTDNSYGIEIAQSSVSTISKNNIYNNSIYGVLNLPPALQIAENNWWGDANGPHNSGSNASGLGDEVSDGVDFDPWEGQEINHTPPLPPPGKTPVLIIPGALGTEIEKGGEVLWIDPEMANPLNLDSFMDPLQFSSNLDPTDNQVIFSNAIQRVLRNVGGVDVTFYDYMYSLVQEFVDQGYTEGKDLFTFPYDWRYGVNDDNISQLQGQIDYILGQTNASKVNVVTHSTGGLLLKKYVQEHTTDHHIDKAVLVGTPNLGSPKAIKVLLQGDSFGVPGLSDNEMKKIAQNLPVIYDLSPGQKYYDVAGSYFKTINYDIPETKDLNFDEANNFLIDNNLANSQAIDNSKNLHSEIFDAYDLRDNGVDVYTITGCKTATFDKSTYSYSQLTVPQINTTSLTTGDGTVPMLSADTIPAADDHRFYILEGEHGKLLSANNVRQKIVNLIADAELSFDQESIVSKQDLDSDPSKCQLQGHWWQIFSPVAIEVVDQDGNRMGIADDGSIQYDIPGGDYEVFGDHKFVFVPTDHGQAYEVNLTGTGNGTFTFKDSTIENNQAVETQVFSNISVTTSTIGEVQLSQSGTTLEVDNHVIQPSVTLVPGQSPEVSTQFSLALKDLQFSSVDSSNTVVDKGSRVDLFDNFGNVTELGFKQTDRKKALSADLESLKYNNVAVDISKNKLSFAWKYDSKGNLTNLTQSVQSKTGFNITATYSSNSTSLSGKDQTGKINQTKPGFWLLRINTNKGDLGWQIIKAP